MDVLALRVMDEMGKELLTHRDEMRDCSDKQVISARLEIWNGYLERGIGEVTDSSVSAVVVLTCD